MLKSLKFGRKIVKATIPVNNTDVFTSSFGESS